MICPLLEVSHKETKQNEEGIIYVSANSSWNKEQSFSLGKASSTRDTEGLKQNDQRVHFCHQSKTAGPCGIQAPADLVCPGPTGVRLLQVLQPDLTSTSLVFPVGVCTHLHIPGYADLSQSEHCTCTDTSGPHTVMRSADGTILFLLSC